MFQKVPQLPPPSSTLTVEFKSKNKDHPNKYLFEIGDLVITKHVEAKVACVVLKLDKGVIVRSGEDFYFNYYHMLIGKMPLPPGLPVGRLVANGDSVLQSFPIGNLVEVKDGDSVVQGRVIGNDDQYVRLDILDKEVSYPKTAYLRTLSTMDDAAEKALRLSKRMIAVVFDHDWVIHDIGSVRKYRVTVNINGNYVVKDIYYL